MRRRNAFSRGLQSTLVLGLAHCLACHHLGLSQDPTVSEAELESRLASAVEAADRGASREAAREYEAVRSLANARRDRAVEGRASAGLARALFDLGESEQAWRLAQRSVDLAVKPALRVDRLLLAAEIAWTLRDTDAFDAALAGAAAAEATVPDAAARAAALRGRLALDRDLLTDAVDALSVAVSAQDDGLRATAHANLARAFVRGGQLDAARTAARSSSDVAEGLPPSRALAFLYLNLARTASRVALDAQASPDSLDEIAARRALDHAEEIALALDDSLLLSYVHGYRSEWAMWSGETDRALDLARRAIFQAARVSAPESEALWSAQLGRLLASVGERAEAIASYERGVRLVESIRAEYTRREGGARRFREEITPLYMELVDLLLQEAADASDDPALLGRAREVLERFKVAELRDYFRDDCVDARASRSRRVDAIATDAVILYPIPLPDRLELLVTLPGGRLVRRAVPDVGVRQLEGVAKQYRRLLTKRTTRQFMGPARQLYRWLIAPIEQDLRDSGVSTLVAVPGGAVRGIPLAALHDGDRFLIEKVALATIPGLELSDPQEFDRGSVQSLLAGLSESVGGYPALPHVRSELASVQKAIGGELLLDEAFEVDRVEQSLRSDPFDVLHLATHAEFLGDADESYLLAWDGRVTMSRLAEYVGLLRRRDDPFDLIVLSACQTAEGDDRAALGLSGVAIRAGARSAIGTLWSVNDSASARLIETFYERLMSAGSTKATALQEAQVSLIRDPFYGHPGYWAAFLLINGWR